MRSENIINCIYVLRICRSRIALMRLRTKSINTWTNRVSLLVGAYLWITGILVVFLPHSPWVIGTFLVLLALSTIGIIFASQLTDKLQFTDDNLFRVHHRLGFATVVTNSEDYGTKLEATLPRNKRASAYNLLLRLGQDICRHRHPSCTACPISNYCTYARNGKLNQA